MKNMQGTMNLEKEKINALIFKIEGRKINNCLIGGTDGINGLNQKNIISNGFYYLGSNPKYPFNSEKAFHLAHFDGQ